MKARLFAAAKFPALHACLAEAGIKLVDIGGRGSAFGGLLPLAPFSDYYVSEPDSAEAERLRQELPHQAPWRSVTVITEAIAARQGEASLHLTVAPGMSSLLTPNSQVTERFYIGSRFRVASVIPVPTVPLDEAASSYEFRDACFLKLDTQGTELDILRSGARLIRESVLGVYTECAFRPFYTDQCLFGDVDACLREQGLLLFSMSRTNLRRANYRPALYSRRVIAWAHCLYLREPETLLRTHSENLRQHVLRLLALALAFEQHDLALELTELIRRERMFDETDARQLANDVGLKCRVSTRRVTRQAQEDGRADVVLAPSYRDKNHHE